MNRATLRQGLTVSALALAIAAGPMAYAQSGKMPATTTVPGKSETGTIPEAASPGSPLAAAPGTQENAPPSFADLVEQVSPAVVNITTTSVVSRPISRGPMFPDGSPFGDLFRNFNGDPGQPGPGDQGNGPFSGPTEQERSTALGSGFVVSPEGMIVTNNHVIEGADKIEVEFFSGGRLPATVVGTDKNTDIAVLKVDAPKPLPFVKFGDSDAAKVGDWVLALGNPLGQGFSASSGIISAKSRALTGTYDDFIQTDAAINRGNSGGPLFNMAGQVVGVNTAILSPNGGSIGIGFSMASNVVKKVVTQLEQYGETRRGWLGVKIQDVTQDIADSLGLTSVAGAMVTDVPPGPAADSGMKAGDVITMFDNGPVKDTRDLVRRVGDAPIGQAVDVTVERDGKPVTLKVTLGRRELAEGNATSGVGGENPPPAGQILGMNVVAVTPDIAAELGLSRNTQGLVVQDVDPEGAAADKGLAPGDLIIQAGQKPVSSVDELQQRIDEAKNAGRKSLLLMVRRGGEARFVALSFE